MKTSISRCTNISFQATFLYWYLSHRHIINFRYSGIDPWCYYLLSVWCLKQCILISRRVPLFRHLSCSSNFWKGLDIISIMLNCLIQNKDPYIRKLSPTLEWNVGDATWMVSRGNIYVPSYWVPALLFFHGLQFELLLLAETSWWARMSGEEMQELRFSVVIVAWRQQQK